MGDEAFVDFLREGFVPRPATAPQKLLLPQPQNNFACRAWRFRPVYAAEMLRICYADVADDYRRHDNDIIMPACQFL